MSLDQVVLEGISQGLAHPCADFLFSWVSKRISFAYPLFLGLLWLLTRYHGGEGARLWFMMIVVVLLGDAAGEQLKLLFAQYRPCAEYYQALQLVPRADMLCSNNPTGMPSGHALNYFAVVGFLAMTTHHRALLAVLAIVAVQVGISRIYLVKHFPSQVLAGAMLGIAWGVFCGWLGRRHLRFVQRVHDGHG